MRLIKWVFKTILSLIIVSILIVTIPLFLLYKDVKPPKITEGETLNIEELINEELEKLFDEDNLEKTINFSVDEDFINREIIELLVSVLETNLSNNPNYLAEYNNMIFFQGVWVTFSDNTISINAGIHLRYEGITYKTRLLINLKLVGFRDGEIILKVSKLNIGNMPFKWLVRVAPEIYKLVTGETFNELLSGYMGEILTYDRRYQNFRVSISELIKEFIENSEMTNGLFKILSEDNFLDLKIDKEDDKYYFNASLNFNKLLSDKEAIILDEDERISSESELNDFTYDKLLEGVILERIRLDSKEITILIDYMLLSSLGDASHLIHQEIYLDYEIKVLRPYFEIGEKAVLNFPLLIGKEDNYLKSNISLEIRFVKVKDDLKLYYDNVLLGELLIDNEMISLLLGSINLSELKFDGDSFLISNFFSLFKTKDIQISHINVSENEININFHKLNSENILEDIINDFPNVIVKDVAERIFDKILNNENIDDEIDELLDIYDSLTEEEQNELFHIINKHLQNIKLT